MNKLRLKLLACVALGLMATPAQAVSVDFDFTGGAFGALTDTLNYTDTDTGLTLQITASTLYPWDTDYTTDSSVKIGQYGQYGLGVVNSQDYASFGNNQPLATDGQHGTDRLNLLFGETVELTSLEFYYYGDNRSFNLFDDLDENGELDTAPLPYEFDINGDIEFDDIFGTLFGVGAGETVVTQDTEYYRSCRWRHRRLRCRWKERETTDYAYSAFKLISLSAETAEGGGGGAPEVPLPASLPLFGTGLALMGYLGMRRRKKANA